MNNWHCTIRDKSKYELIRLIEQYDRYIRDFCNGNNLNCKTIEDFLSEDCAELEL